MKIENIENANVFVIGSGKAGRKTFKEVIENVQINSIENVEVKRKIEKLEITDSISPRIDFKELNEMVTQLVRKIPKKSTEEEYKVIRKAIKNMSIFTKNNNESELTSELDEFDLAGFHLTKEEKNKLRQLDIPTDTIINILSGKQTFTLQASEPKKENKKTWKKNKFWE